MTLRNFLNAIAAHLPKADKVLFHAAAPLVKSLFRSSERNAHHRKTNLSTNKRRQLRNSAQAEILEVRALLSGMYQVDHFTDENDGDTSAGNLSLREAVLLANQDGVDSTITLAPGTYELTIAGAYEDAGLTGDLDVLADGSLTVIGAGAGQTIITAGGSGGIRDRVFDTFTRLTVDSLTVTGGYLVRESRLAIQYGGGIQSSVTTSSEPLTILNSEIIGNTVTGVSGNGGGGVGIPTSGSTTNSRVVLFNSVVADNFSNWNGGGIHAAVIIADQTLFENNRSHADGGGIQTNQAIITDSTFRGNQSGDGAALMLLSASSSRLDGVSIYENVSVTGAVYFSGGSPTLTVTNTSIIGNTGRGFYTRSPSESTAARTTFTNTTIVGNTDAGIRNRDFSYVTLNNTIVAGNDTDSATALNVTTTYLRTSGSHNLIGNSDPVGEIEHGVDGNILGNDGVGVIDPTTVFVDVNGDGIINAADLADNGGATKTLMLRADSLAVDSGSDSLAQAANLTTDQRGSDRFQGAAVDRGAVEIFQGTYTVTVFEDENDGDTSPGDLSLREAVLLANQDGVDSTINLAAGTYELSIAGAYEDAGLTGDLDVLADGSLTVIGAGAGQTIITAGGSGGIRDRVFDGFTKMTLDSLTVTGGYAVREVGQPRQYGGGIRYALTTTDKPLTVVNSEITGNWAENGGGGIYVPNHAGGGVSAKVNILNSVISHNRAASGGGGGVVSTIVVADGSSFHNNSAPGNGGAILTPRPSLTDSSFYANSGSSGSAIWIGGIPGVIGSIKNVSFYDNNSKLGTVWVSSGSYRLNVTNSTIVGNTGSGPGFFSSGSHFNNNTPVITTFTNSTIAGNSGPGFDIRSHSTVYLNNTIVAGNGLSSGQIDLRTEQVSASGFIGAHSLIGNPNQPFNNTSQVGVLVHGEDGNIVGNDGVGVIDPTTIFVDVNSDGIINADDLADNGGPTKTLMLRADSLAVDSGSDSLAQAANLTTDQRGSDRFQGAAVDRGAVEIFQGSYTVTVLEDENDGDTSPGDLSLREAVLLANQDGVDSTITLAAGTYELTLTGSLEDEGLTGDLDVFADGSLTILGAGIGQTIINAGGSTGIRDRVFDTRTQMTLNGLTVAGGYLASDLGTGGENGDRVGGGIRYNPTVSGEALQILNSEITGNTVGNDGWGAGIGSPGKFSSSNRMRVELTNSIVSHNYSGRIGGGIRAYLVTATQTEFHNNRAAIDAGGIDAVRVFITDSTFRENYAAQFGAAIRVTGLLQLDGVTFHDNEGPRQTIYSGGFISPNEIKNSTFVGDAGDAYYSSGTYHTIFTNTTIVQNSRAGIRLTNNSTVQLNNTIVAGNGGAINPIDIFGTASASHSLLGSSNYTVGVQHGVDGNIVGDNGAGVLNLTTIFVDVNGDGIINAADLADNGGPTLTLALRADGPAVDAGSNTLASAAGLTNDQRGVGFPRVLGSIVDMGAFEAEAAVNQQPSAEDASATTDEDAGIFSLDANALVSDADTSDVLAITSIVQDSGRSVTFESIVGVLSFDADQFNDLAIGESESLVFTYTVDDQQDQANSTNTGMLTITIEGRNDSPILQPLNGTGSITLNEDADVSIPLLISDADGDRLYSPPGQGDVLTVTFSHDNPELFGNGDLSIMNNNPRELRIRPRPDAFGSATVTVMVSDGTDSVSRQLNVTVLPVNDPPVATIGFFDDKQTHQNTPLTPPEFIFDVEQKLFASDFAFTTSNPALLPLENITINTFPDGEVRDFTYTPAPNQFGEVIVGVTATDGLDTLTGSFRLTVHPVDAAAPVSGMHALPAFASSLNVPLQWSAADASGEIVSGVDTVTVQYAVTPRLTADTEWTSWQTFDAGVNSATFIAESNRKIWFRTIATDAAGNVEQKVGADTRIQVGDFTAPITQINSAQVEDGTIRLQISGRDGVGGSNIKRFDLYASIDGSPAVLVGSVDPDFSVLDLGTGEFLSQATFNYPGQADGIERNYVFYSVGVDHADNVESPPAGSSEDVSLTHTFANEPLRVLSFDVQKGLQQRSFIDTLDVTFNTTDAAVLQELIDNNRLGLEKFAIDSAAADVNQGTGQAIDLSTATFEIINAATIRIHLGNAINDQTNPFLSNGFYRLSVDTNTDNVFDQDDAHLEFFRLYGDRNGDGRIDGDDAFSLDRSTLSDLNNDLNGDGFVDSNDTRVYQMWSYFSNLRSGMQEDHPFASILDDYLSVLNDELLGFLDD